MTRISNVLVFADHKARLLGRKLLQLQDDISNMASAVLRGQAGLDVDLAERLEVAEKIVDDLERCSDQISILDLRVAIGGLVRAHKRWSRAKLGSEAERTYAKEYLRCLDRLEQCVG